jgi:hypothetical protein
MNSIQVKNLEGKPVSGATAVCVSPETPAVLKGFTLEGGGERLQTDADGRLMLHLTEQNAFIVIANEHGFGLAPGYDLSRNPNMVVKPWGRIEGVRTNCGRPMANRRLRFRLGWREVGSHEITQSLRIPMETTTDSQGHFRFEHVPAMAIVISEARECPTAVWFPLPVRVLVKPETTTFVELATQGQTVVGHLNLENGLPEGIDPKELNDPKKFRGSLNLDPIRPQPPDPPEAIDSIAERTKWWQAWFETETGGNWFRSVLAGTIFGFNSDGSFAAELVEPERFYVSCQYDRNGETVHLHDKASYVIPAAASDACKPFDIGKINLEKFG